MTSLLDKLGKKSEGDKTKSSAVKAKDEKKKSAPVLSSKNNSKRKDFHSAYKTIVRPLVSEKGTYLQEQNKYFFEVSDGANKISVKQAVETLYDVDVVKVNIQNRAGKKVNYGRRSGRRKAWVKAIVTLKPGQRITTVEGV